jgi:hypothetical protein
MRAGSSLIDKSIGGTGEGEPTAGVGAATGGCGVGSNGATYCIAARSRSGSALHSCRANVTVSADGVSAAGCPSMATNVPGNKFTGARRIERMQSATADPKKEEIEVTDTTTRLRKHQCDLSTIKNKW